jgi:DNA-binding response OmpR family regulator
MTNGITTSLKPVILIVEDEAPIRMGLSAAMSRLGYRVITAENGGDALLKAADNHPDLIITDIMMPVIDGLELKNRLKADPELATIPLIYLSARTSTEDKVAGIRGGADDYLTKPFDLDELTARVEAVLRRAYGERQVGFDIARQIDREDLDKLRRELMQNFHHEIRTPLNNVMLFLEIAATQKFDSLEEQKEFVRIARASGDRLESLVSDIIFLTDLDQGLVNNIRQPVNLDVQFLPALKRRLSQYDNKNLNFLPVFSTTGQIKAPRHEFVHALLHLADNAFKFSPNEGTIIMKIDHGKKGGATITMEDQGPGIPPELREKVFERYYQISRGPSREFQGLGLGLTVARAVFRSCGGDVKIIDSARGCSVQANLPDLKGNEAAYG